MKQIYEAPQAEIFLFDFTARVLAATGGIDQDSSLTENENGHVTGSGDDAWAN